MTKRIIRNYVVFYLLLACANAFSFATYALFLASLGLSLLQINVVNFLFMSACMLFEVPTGVIADLFGRKRAVVAGCFIMALGFSLYSRAVGFWTSILSEVTIALGLTFISGAMNAWVVDLLNHHGYKDGLMKVFKRRGQVDRLGAIVGSLVGGVFLGSSDLSWPWLGAAAGCVITGVFAWSVMSEEYFETGKRKSFRQIHSAAREAVGYSFKHRAVLYIMALSILIVVITQSLNMHWPFVFKHNHGFSVPMISFLMSGILIALFIGSSLSVRVASLFKNDKQALILPQFITVVGIMFAASKLGLYPVLVGFLAHEVGRGVFEPIRETYLNHRIQDRNRRASILSFQSMAVKLGAAIGLLASGFIADRFSISISWYCSAIVLGLGLPLFLGIKNGEESSTAQIKEVA